MRSIAFVMLLSGCGFRIDIANTDGAATDAAGGADVSTLVDGSQTIDGAMGTCPSGYGPINGVGMYRSVEDQERQWDQAEEDCNDDDDDGSFSNHTHLVVISTDTERLALTNGTSPVSGNTWIGLSDRDTEGIFLWVTDEPTGGYPVVGASPWDSDDPDNGGQGEDCVRFKNSFVFEDKPCDDQQSYVCECDAFAPN